MYTIFGSARICALRSQRVKEAKKNKIGSCGLDAKLDNGVRVGHRAIQIKSRVLCYAKNNK